MSPQEQQTPKPLRERAEALLRARCFADVSDMSADQIRSLVHELRVHQVELELQNEELRQAQLELSETRDRYLDLYEFAPVGYATLNRDGQIEQANLALATILDIPRKELVGTTIARHVHFDDQDALYQHRREVFTSRASESDGVPLPAAKKSCELRFPRKNGTTMTLRLESTPVEDTSGNIQLCRTALIDVTAQREAEVALREMNEELEQRVAERTAEIALMAKAVENLGEGILITGDHLDWPGPTIVFVNKAMCCITGYEADELIGQTPRLLQGGTTDRKTLDRLRKDLAANRPCKVELVNYRKDGTPYHCELFITPLFNGDGERINFVSVHRDISARKRAEAELLRAHQRLEAVVETAPSLIVVTDQAGQIVLFNRACEDLTGYTRQEVLGQTIADLFLPPNWRPIVENRFANLRDPQLKEPHENPWLTKTGNERLIEWRCIPFSQDDETSDWFLLGIGVDITERKQIERSLLESEAQTKSILASLSAHIAVLDRTGRIIAVNPAWEEFARQNAGRPDRCNVGANYLEVCRSSRGLYANKAFAVAEGLETILRGTTTEFTAEYPCHSDTEQRWFLLQATPLRSADGGAVVSHTNITERVLAEQRLKESEERLRSILNTAADAIVIIDQSGIIDGVNPATEKLFGHTEEELIGQNVSVLMPPPYREEHDGYIRRYLETQQARIIGVGRELVAQRKDGSVFPMELAISEVDHLGFFVGLIRDITERKEMERQVLQVVAEEQKRIGQELHDDVGQEMTGLSLKLSALMKKMNQGSVDVLLASKLIQDVQRTREKLGVLSRGLIPVAVDRDGLLVALERLAERFQEVDVTCEVICTQRVRIADAEQATQLYHITQESVSNAFKHGKATHVSIRLQEHEGKIALSVQDNGIGIDPSEAAQASGMGLRIMVHRAGLIGGHLTVRPHEQGGTIVTCIVETGAIHDRDRRDTT